MATMTRESVMMLPAIKCSVCSADVEIPLLGDHVCGPAPKEPFLSSPRGLRSTAQAQKPFTLPPIDAYAANSPFLTVDQLTPPSSTSAHSPTSPQDDQPLQVPSYRNTISASDASRDSAGSRPICSPFPPKQDPDSPTIPPQGYYASRPPYSPTLPPSPTMGGGKDLLARLNTIAPGPFGPRRGSNDKTPETPLPPSRSAHFPGRGSSRAYGVELLKAVAASLPDHDQTDLCHENQSVAQSTDRNTRHFKTNLPVESRPGALPKSPAPPQLQASASTNTSSQSPNKSKRRPPHPGVGLPRTPSQYRQKKGTTKAISPSPATPSPPIFSTGNRPQSLNQDTDSAERALPPPPPPTPPPQAQRFPARKKVSAKPERPLHKSALSVSSSTSSEFSYISKSSRSSPPSSEISIASKMSGPKFVDPKTFNHNEHKRPPVPRDGDNLIDNFMNQLHTSMDPRRPSKDDNPSPTETQLPLPSQQQHQHSLDHSKSIAHPPIGARHASTHPSRTPEPVAQGDRRHRRTPTTSKGPCRGCGEQIVGKSISSADGRLTGRYHKQCFSCQTCRQPFQSAEFYVMDNLPYCERHYHELNNSLCAVCDRGIEGPCLETVRQERFHPSCFTCYKCRCVLGDDYFEINGRPFCEDHARRYMQRPPRPPPSRDGNNGRGGLRVPGPTPKVERRRTRLMFMGMDTPHVPGVGSRYFI